MELLATSRAVYWYRSSASKTPIFEGEFEMVINSLRNGDWLMSTIGHLAQDTLSFVYGVDHFLTLVGKVMLLCMP